MKVQRLMKVIAISAGLLTAVKYDVPQRLTALPYQIAAPQYSVCSRCHMPWAFVNFHVTQHVFVICDYCWQDLQTPEKRMPYYERHFQEYPHDAEEVRFIRKAVSQGE